jgi:CRISPR-associated protein Cmr2
MRSLRQLFDNQVNIHLPEHLKLTFSAGVAIAHYKTPLSEVLNYARAMEKKAKKVENKTNNTIKKDAFSIAVLKHSGEIHDTTFRWNYKTKDENREVEVWSTEVLKELTKYLKDKDISDKFITNLSQTFAKLLDKNGDWWFDTSKQSKISQQQEDSLNAIFKFELERFAERAKTEDGGIKDIKGFCDKLYTLYHNHIDFDLNVQNFLNALHICEFISRHLNKENQATENIAQPQTATAQ